MEELLTDLISVLGDFERMKQNVVFQKDQYPGFMVPFTSDIVFVDVTSWIVTEVEDPSISRKGLLERFIKWINQLWLSRPRCRMIVIVAERPRFIPLCRHAAGQDGLKGHNSECPVDPLPYMWDDANLGGPQGFQAWICRVQGRVECTRTLLHDLINSRENQRLSPFPDKPLVIDGDFPHGTCIFWRDVTEPQFVVDPQVPGCTGESFFATKAFISLIHKIHFADALGARTYELISSNPQWCLMAIHTSYLLEKGSFGGPTLLRKGPTGTWHPKTRVWLRISTEELFSADAYYALLKTKDFLLYEPWSHCLALWHLCSNPLLYGSRIASLSFSDLWERFLGWGLARQKDVPDGSNEKLYAGAFIFVNPDTQTVVANEKAFWSFVQFVHVDRDDQEAQKDTAVVPTDKEMAAWFGLSRDAIAKRLLDYIRNSGWKVVLEKSCEGPFPLSLIQIPLESRRSLAKIINLRIEKDEQLWKEITELEPFLRVERAENVVFKQLGEDVIKNLCEIYEKHVKDMIGKAFASINKALSERGDFKTRIRKCCPASDPILGILGTEIIEVHGIHFAYEPDDAGKRLASAWKNTFWSLVYLTIGDLPHFVQENWYMNGDTWGWSPVNGSPTLSSASGLDWAKHYKSLDIKRTLTPSSNRTYHEWTAMFQKDKLPHDFNGLHNFGKAIKEPDVCHLHVKKDDDGYLVFVGENDLANALKKVAGKSSIPKSLSIPKTLWNAYMLKLVPVHLIKEGKIEYGASLMISRTFNLLWGYTKNTSANPIPNADEANVRAAFVLATKLLDFLDKHKSQEIPWYAETWMRELLDRCWYFVTPQTLPYDTVVENALQDALLQRLAQGGFYGLFLDYFFKRLGSTTPQNGTRFCKTVVFRSKNDELSLPLGDAELSQDVQGKSLLYNTTELGPQKWNIHAKIDKPDESIISYDCISIKNEPGRKLSDTTTLKDALKFFGLMTIWRLAHFHKPVNLVPWELAWSTSHTVSGLQTRSWIVYPSGIVNAKAPLAEPFRTIYLGTLKSSPGTADPELSVVVFTDPNMTAVTFRCASEIFRLDPILPNKTEYYIGYRKTSKTGQGITVTWTLYVEKYPPMSGVIYGQDAAKLGTLEIIMFDSLLWASGKRRKHFIDCLQDPNIPWTSNDFLTLREASTHYRHK